MLEHVIPVIGVSLASLAVTAVLQSSFPSKESRWILGGWAVTFFSTWANLALVLLVYKTGDVIGYHRGGVNLAAIARVDPLVVIPEMVRLILQLPIHLSVSLHGAKPSTLSMNGFAGFACLLTNDSLFAMSLLFSMVAYVTRILAYAAVRSIFPSNFRFPLLIALFYLPSATFWSAGLVKEGIVMTGLGLLAYGARKLSLRRLSGLTISVFGLLPVMLIKPYVGLTIFLSGSAYWYWQRSVKNNRFKIRPVTLALGVALGLGSFLLIGRAFPRYSLDNIAEEAASLQAAADSHKNGGSSYHMGSKSSSPAQMLLTLPFALFTSLYRPALWDVRSPPVLVASIETTIFLLLTLRGALLSRRQGYMTALIKYPFLMFCLVYVLILGVIVGITTTNLGTLTRYRAPLMPFFAVLLIAFNLPQPQTATSKKRRRRRLISPNIHNHQVTNR